MKPAPIRLLNYFLTELHVQARADFNATEDADWKESAFNVDHDARPLEQEGTGPRKWKIELGIAHQPAAEDNFPYSFRLKLVAFVEETPSSGALDDDLRQRTVKVNGTSMLYGAAREIIRAATGRGPHSCVLLPAISFYERKAAAQGTAPNKSDITAPKKSPRQRALGHPKAPRTRLSRIIDPENK